MEYMTTKEAVKKWNISERRIRQLLSDGRIEGAVKVGNSWNIPIDALKPTDKRIIRPDENKFIINVENDFFDEVDNLKKKLDSKRPIPKETLKSLKESINLEWTYNSNGIEGNTLTLRETQVVLEGITVGGKSIKEHLEAINHEQAILFLDELVKEDNPITEWNIKNIHQLILKEIDNENAGKYRKENVTIKGAAHIGVLQSLEEHNINIDYISGTSSGSIVATLYSIGYSPSEIYNFFKHYSKDITHIGFKNIFKLISGLLLKHKIIIDGLNDGKKLEKIMYKICAKKDIYTIDQINLPLLIPSVNIENGETYIFTSKKIRNVYQDNYVYDNSILVSKAVRASCSFPGIYSPCHYQNKILVDGGIRENIPWKGTKKLGANTVLSIIFERTLEPDPF